ncbi:probable S-adenosylmethionine-dependent methyltransferase At5g37990 [Rhodamnia argentea]|uniref:Probable S-adenosylmethionine-dependent methyltransferase At5g37990 n=1 Tax=Rhodamnia argentea TaxID=178133 RepID=A0ABM3HLN6_9MYRT|nr:probable S-adenosylmethionine-dependent methyltransferase At5g37990 [Rhodamnia argentea]
MDDERKMSITGAMAMNGGNGHYSYALNSSYQKGVIVAAMDMIKEALPATVDLNHLSSSSPNPIIRIADFGCSTGLTSIQAIETIIRCLLDLIKPVEQPQSRTLEFQAILNDLPTNDFNTLFADLPPERRRYYVAAAPGSFHGRLLPSASLHLAYSSCALHWLSRVPQEILDKSSRAWNGERIHYASSPAEVVGAYSAQFGRDMEAFLSARAEEMVGEGLIFMVVPGEPDLVHDSRTTMGSELELLGSCLVDMAKAGAVSKAKVESFNVPIYFPSRKELQQVIGRNRFFDIRKIQTSSHPKMHVALSTPESLSLLYRAVSEGLLLHHFGDELIIDDLFHRFSLKAAKSPFFLKPESHETITFFVVLKRKKSEENMQ